MARILTKTLLLALLFTLIPFGIWAKTLRVLTTTPDLADIVRQVGGEKVKVESLASPVQNPHFVDAKPSLILKIMKANLFIQTGMDLEIGWAPVLLQSSGNRKIQKGSPGYLNCSIFIKPMEIPINPDRSMGDVHPQGNPHYMLDPENVILVARGIVEKLSTLSPDDTEVFQSNLTNFEANLMTHLKIWEEMMLPYEGTEFVSYHKIYPYFATRFGIKEVGEIEPKPGIPPTASHTAELIARMKARNVKLILIEPWYETRTSGSISSSVGAKVVTMNLFPGASPETGDYISMMENNLKKIIEAFAKK